MTWQRIVFDFDGTLAHRPGRWAQCLLDVLDASLPSHTVTIEDLRAQLQRGFPWQRPGVAHPELDDSDAWWAAVGSVVSAAYAACGVEQHELPDLTADVRKRYCDPSSFVVYDDTFAGLERLRNEGLDVCVLSNHVPELSQIVAALGLRATLREVWSSASIGFEKPHPQAFAAALHDVDPARCWMVGDDPVADVDGAEAAGMNALLVRHPRCRDRTVVQAVELILDCGQASASR